MGWLLNTQLCPVIWGLILALVAVLVYKVPPAPNLYIPRRHALLVQAT